MKFVSTILLALTLHAAHPSYGEDRVASWPRIINGIEADVDQFPFQVTVLRDGSLHCGGAILSSNYIVTAGHCVFKEKENELVKLEASSLSVRVGSIHHNQGGEVIRVADYTLYPDFTLSNFDHDIALLRLSSPLILNNVSVAAIPLATSPPPENAEVTIVGWGRSSFDGPASERLNCMKMNVLPATGCHSLFAPPREHILCLLGDGTNGPCRGDSGSAAIYQGTLVAVVSSGGVRCSTYSPTTGTFVPAYVDWLKAHSDL